MASKRIYRSTRDLHLYLGLFVSPFVRLYAITVILLNHAYMPWGGNEGPVVTSSVAVSFFLILFTLNRSGIVGGANA